MHDIEVWTSRPIEFQPDIIDSDGTPKTAADLLDSENFDVDLLLELAAKEEAKAPILWRSFSNTAMFGVNLETGEAIEIRGGGK